VVNAPFTSLSFKRWWAQIIDITRKFGDNIFVKDAINVNLDPTFDNAEIMPEEQT